MTIYDEFISEVRKGSRFRVNLADKDLSVGNKSLITKGEYNGDLISECEDVYGVLNDLYLNYKYSCPPQKANGNKPYFKALKFEEINESMMAYGDNRNEAQALLEAFVLCHGLLGNLKVNKGWFWQSETEKDFIILKMWLQ